MGLSLLIAAFLAPPLVRDLRPGPERKYRVEVVQDAGDRYAYRLRLKMVEAKAAKVGAKGEARLEVRLTDYRGTMDGQNVSARLIGGGQMPLGSSGIPVGLSVVGPQGPVWLPLLSLAFPGGEDGEFNLPTTEVGPGIGFVGKGSLSRKDGKPRVEIEASLVRSGTALGKLTLSTTLDGGGWPQRSEGTLVSADGTYRFTVEKG